MKISIRDIKKSNREQAKFWMYRIACNTRKTDEVTKVVLMETPYTGMHTQYRGIHTPYYIVSIHDTDH